MLLVLVLVFFSKLVAVSQVVISCYPNHPVNYQPANLVKRFVLTRKPTKKCTTLSFLSKSRLRYKKKNPRYNHL